MAATIRSLTPIEHALRLQEDAADIGLDWTTAEDLWSRINEELAEVKAATEDMSVLKARIAAREKRYRDADPGPQNGSDAAHRLLREELGDLIFATIDLCRVLQVDPRAALEVANRNFGACCAYVDNKIRAEGLLLALVPPERLRAIWAEAEARRSADHFPEALDAAEHEKREYGTA